MRADDHEFSLPRQLRLLTILDGAERAGIAPLEARQIHLIAYLTNALAPVWNLEPLTSELLKLYGAPYDAGLQQDIDRLVFSGLVLCSDLSYYQDESLKWRVSALYELNRPIADALLQELRYLPDEQTTADVAAEICLAISALPPEAVERSLGLDAAYSSGESSVGSLLNLYDDNRTNRSSSAANLFGSLAPEGTSFSPTERVNLYIRHLYRMSESA